MTPNFVRWQTPFQYPFDKQNTGRFGSQKALVENLGKVSRLAINVPYILDRPGGTLDIYVLAGDGGKEIGSVIDIRLPIKRQAKVLGPFNFSIYEMPDNQVTAMPTTLPNPIDLQNLVTSLMRHNQSNVLSAEGIDDNGLLLLFPALVPYVDPESKSDTE